MKAGRLWIGLVALTLTAAAHAEKYVEIWNPPEARGHVGGSQAQKPLRPHAQKPSTPRLARKVTEPGNATAVHGASSVVSNKRPGNRIIPRKIGPDGNVFRV
ncbi:hypothetical protein [Paraburkholderia azotifigens]|uniref:Uncharacterized protein n=1 Tax=Paraburkholderia azotifigens TaxID=2057004 RepID=A0A5C6VBB3_9BURK|nr:hypothetical protein [Paraburkholderia azotifigens]TXC82250.1 hypothetical protein FRZ40_17285 [Paraburkholderia azotifigens]